MATPIRMIVSPAAPARRGVGCVRVNYAIVDGIVALARRLTGAAADSGQEMEKRMHNRWGRLAVLGAAVLSFGALAALDATAQDDKRVRWKMHSAFGGRLTGLGPPGIQFSDLLKKMSEGRIDIKFFEPGALVPGLQGFDAVQTGSIESSWNSAGYFAGKEPAAAFYTAVPFGPQFDEFMAWYKKGGGRDIQWEIYKPYGVRPNVCNYVSPESSGWFRKEIKSLQDLKGLKMRFFGLGAQVMEKFGVSTQLLAAGDIYPALELGTIDATEFSNPAIDLDLGFFQVAKHYYFPGWHQQATFVEFQANQAKWDGLNETQKLLIDVACDANLTNTVADNTAAQPSALKKIAEKGVTLHRWSPEVLAALEKAWNEVLAEQSVKNANFKKIADSYLAFRKEYETWRKLGYIH